MFVITGFHCTSGLTLNDVDHSRMVSRVGGRAGVGAGVVRHHHLDLQHRNDDRTNPILSSCWFQPCRTVTLMRHFRHRKLWHRCWCDGCCDVCRVVIKWRFVQFINVFWNGVTRPYVNAFSPGIVNNVVVAIPIHVWRWTWNAFFKTTPKAVPFYKEKYFSSDCKTV